MDFPLPLLINLGGDKTVESKLNTQVLKCIYGVRVGRIIFF